MDPNLIYDEKYLNAPAISKTNDEESKEEMAIQELGEELQIQSDQLNNKPKQTQTELRQLIRV